MSKPPKLPSVSWAKDYIDFWGKSNLAPTNTGKLIIAYRDGKLVERKVCVWTMVTDKDGYTACKTCGKGEWGTIVAESFKFCPYCGGHIELRKPGQKVDKK